MLKVAKKLPYNLHGGAFSTNEESLPISYYNFYHKSLVRPKSKTDKDHNP